MNEHFVNIKVDREERPDLDSVYMQAVQAMTGHGGWPMTMFLLPDGAPFYGGTYFPPTDRHGMPSFTKVLQAVAETYKTRRTSATTAAAAVREIYRGAEAAAQQGGEVTAITLDHVYREVAKQYDATYGGFGDAPKFPPTMVLDFLLHRWARTGTEHALEIARHTFLRMARGGIYDQVGGGFARYAVDQQWLVPHFEKPLLDSTLLARLGTHLWQITGNHEIRRVTEETLDWMLKEMSHPAGGFYSTLDADSEGSEGKFYLWDARELDRLLGDDAPLIKAYFGVSNAGNFEGRNILHVPHDPAAFAARHDMTEERLAALVAHAKHVLYNARARRVWPERDEKVLASWNGLAVRTFAEAARVFDSEPYRNAALRCGEFLRTTLIQNGTLFRSYRDGDIRIVGFLEDYAAVALGMLSLYELSFDRTWLDQALSLQRMMLDRFWDGERRIFFDTAHDAEVLITRPRDITDNAFPAGNSLAAELLLRTTTLTEDSQAREILTTVVQSLSSSMARFPMAFGHLLSVADGLVGGATELVLVGTPSTRDFLEFVDATRSRYFPFVVFAGGIPSSTGSDFPLLADRPMIDDHVTAYVCQRHVCSAPITTANQLQAHLQAM
jgi:uncharacterized protein YyaL (SSP411 family)